MTNEPRETPIADALSRLRDRIDVPPIDPRREQALLAAFDAHWARPRARDGHWAWTTAAIALIAIVVALNWLVVTGAPRINRVMPDPASDLAGFVPWPGAQAWPPLESGELRRIDLPASALPALGLWPPASGASVVQVEIVVGQDGFARAIRLVQ